MQLQHLIVGTGCTLYLFRPVICILTTRHCVLQSIFISDQNYVTLMNARVACLSTGSHGLSYRRSSGRSAQHSFLNNLIFHALSQARISSIKEPTGLSRSDGKRPDGLKLTLLGKLGKMPSEM